LQRPAQSDTYTGTFTPIVAAHGLVFFAGQSAARPVYAPPYWDPHDNPDLMHQRDDIANETD
jgi:hypothetical protein